MKPRFWIFWGWTFLIGLCIAFILHACNNQEEMKPRIVYTPPKEKVLIEKIAKWGLSGGFYKVTIDSMVYIMVHGYHESSLTPHGKIKPK